MFLDANTLNMSNKEFNRMLQNELLDFFKQHKHFAYELSEIQEFEPFKWVNCRIVAANLKVLCDTNQIEKKIKKVGLAPYASFKYINPKKTAKINAMWENEKIRYLKYIEQNEKF